MPHRAGDLGKPLISLTTDLKSLKYKQVSDTTGKTSGKDPYVTKPIPNHYFVDGELKTDPTPPDASGIIQSRVDDFNRFKKLAIDKPGRKFAINQAILGQNPVQIAKTAAAILAQVPVNGTGTHFVHGFVVDTYLQKDIGQGTALGRFLAENLGINNLNGAGRALQGRQIISDNEGQENWRPNGPSLLVDRNSKYDLKPGADNDTIDSLLTQYLRPDIVAFGKTAASLVKGLFSKNKKDKASGKKLNLSNIFKANPDNLGQEGFRTEKDGDSSISHEDIASNLKGKDVYKTYTVSGTSDIQGRPIIKGTPPGTNAKIISDNNGGLGFTPNTLETDTLKDKESTQTIFNNGTESSIKPNISPETDSLLKKEGRVLEGNIVPDNRGQQGFNPDQYAQYNVEERLIKEEDARSDLNKNSIVNTYYRSANLNDVEFNQENAASAAGAGQIQEGNIDGRLLIKGLPSGSNAKIIRENTVENSEYFNEDFVQAKGYFTAKTQDRSTEEPSVYTNLPDNVTNPVRGGRVEASLGTEYDVQTTGYIKKTVDEDGNPLIIQGETVEAGTVPATQLKYFQDDYSEYGLEFDSGQISNSDGKGRRFTKLIDFRKIRKDSGLPIAFDFGENGFDSPTDLGDLDYSTDNVEIRLGYANNPGTMIGVAGSDKVNMSDFVSDSDTEILQSQMIPFQIASVQPDGNIFMYFRAFLDDLSDSYSGDWSGTNFVGRAEEFYTYQGFKRDINFSFKIAAFTEQELKPLYLKLNLLAGTTAPSYGTAGTFMRGTLTEVTIGDYLSRLKGFFSSVNITWKKEYPWEIDLYNQDLLMVPHVLDVSCKFTPIHDFNVNANLTFGQGERYIGSSKLNS